MAIMVIRKNGLRYVSFIGDSDLSTFQTIKDAKPNGDDIIVKKECVGHVQKRLGTCLRKIEKFPLKEKIVGWQRHQWQGRLTDKLIDTMQNFYGLL